jgi:small-conductance mechanosensitive channel
MVLGVTWSEFWSNLTMDPDVQMRFLVAVLTIALYISLGYLVRWFLSFYAKNVAQKTKTRIDDFIMAAVHPPAVLVAVTVGFWLAFRIVRNDLPFAFATEIFFFIVLVVLVTYVAARVLAASLRYAASDKPRWEHLVNIGSRVGYLLAFTIGFLIILKSQGVEITPLLTSLGIAGLAVALALQDTLANLFAGLWIQTGKTVRSGHYIKVEDINQDGWITEVSWRTTRILTRKNNLVSVPNTKMASSVITNYDLPQPDQAALLFVGVSFRSDPEHVERVLLEVANGAIGTVASLLPEPEPIVRFLNYGDSALEFLLVVRVQRYVDQFAVLHELRKRIFVAFDREGIEIPFPHRTVYLRQESDEKELRLRVGRAEAGNGGPAEA